MTITTLLILFQLLAGVALGARTTNGVIKSHRLLQEDAHDHEDLAATLKWAGIFHFAPGAVYNLTVKVPSGDSDPHAGHNHRSLIGRRGLEGDDEHAGHDHSSHSEAEEDHSGHDHSSHSEAEEGHSAEVGAHFLLALVPVSAEGQEGIDEAIEIVKSMEGSLVNVKDGDAIVPTKEQAYELFFHDPDASSTLSMINITQEKYVLFLPATPSQVQGDVHFLVDEQGTKVWPYTARYQTEPDPREEEKPWGVVIGATLLINCVTLIGVIFLVPMLTTACKNKSMREALRELTTSSDIHLIGGRTQQVFDMCITSFACGALLATTVFLIVPEAIVLVNSSEDEGEDSHEGHDHRMLQEDDHSGHDHGNNNWVFGTSLLAGFLFPMFLASFFPHHHGHVDPHSSVLSAQNDETEELKKDKARRTTMMTVKDDEEIVDGIVAEIDVDKVDAKSNEMQELDSRLTPKAADIISARDADTGEVESEEPLDEVEPRKKKEVNKRLISGILLGDALHNFADGVFVGAAFMLCDSALGWSVLASTIYHELAQEVSDFFILTTHGHLPPLIALALNFASGLAVTLGGIVVLGTNVSNYALGVILSMSAGVYVNVAAKECMPTVDRLAVTTWDRFLAFLFFAVGAIPIGLVLLNHEHCEV